MTKRSVAVGHNKYKQKDEIIKAVRTGRDHNRRTIKKKKKEEGQTKRPPWLRNTKCMRMLARRVPI